MAASRPIVKVTQQFATQSVTVATPDLNCLIVGPAYHVQDYSATNKANIKSATDYGVRNDPCTAAGLPANLPIASTPTITLAEPLNNITGAILDSDSVILYMDEALVNITNAGDGVTVNNQATLTSAGSNFGSGGTNVQVGDRVVLTDISTSITIERLVQEVTSNTVLTMTANMNTAGTDIDGTAYTTWDHTAIAFRVERKLDDKAVAAAFVTVAAQSTVLDGGVTLSDAGPPVLTDRVVNYAEVYQEYRSLRQDLSTVQELNSTSAIIGALGATDERNPLATGAFVALQNTSSPVQVYGITTDDLNGGSDRLTGYTTARDEIEGRKDIYVIVPLANEFAVLSLWKNHVVALADPEKSNFRIAIGSSTLPVTKIVSVVSALGDDEIDVADPIVVFVDPAATFVTNNVTATDVLVISGAATLNGTYEIRRTLSETILEIDGVAGGDGDFPGAVTDETASYAIGVKETGSAIPVTARGRISRLLDNSASFITDAVKVGDLIEIPANGGTDFTTTLDSFTVSAIISENRLDTDIGVLGVKELPSTSAGRAVKTAISYRVSRTLSKADQVTDLVADSNSLKSSRVTLMWPDSCKVAGVTNAKTGVQGTSPGYYLGCAVGGMVAGFPSHQNFTTRIDAHRWDGKSRAAPSGGNMCNGARGIYFKAVKFCL